jgi:hypothetical protein
MMDLNWVICCYGLFFRESLLFPLTTLIFASFFSPRFSRSIWDIGYLDIGSSVEISMKNFMYFGICCLGSSSYYHLARCNSASLIDHSGLASSRLDITMA